MGARIRKERGNTAHSAEMGQGAGLTRPGDNFALTGGAPVGYISRYRRPDKQPSPARINAARI